MNGPVYVLHFASGSEVASAIAEAMGAEAVLLSGGVEEAFSSRWSDAGGFVFIGALAIAVRSTAKLLSDKKSDPSLVVVPEDGGAVIPVFSGHVGGGTDLARRTADILADRGALFVPTTASDRSGFTAPDLWAARRGYKIINSRGLVSVIRRLIDKGEISVWLDPIFTEHRVSFPLPAGYSVTENQESAELLISPRHVQSGDGQKPQIVPRVVTAGIGCRQGVSAEKIEFILNRALAGSPEGEFLPEALTELRTSSVKSGEPGLLALADRMGLAIKFLSDEEIIAEGDDFSPSAAARHFGIPGVAEPSAASAGALLAPRIAEEGVTVALAFVTPAERGTLSVVGTGPGDARFLTAEASDAIASSDVVAGYGLYVDLLPARALRGKIVERYGMGEEEKRVIQAISYARAGYRVALLSGGDASLFGLSSLALTLAEECDDIRIIPGITAAQAAGVAAGAPYSNGLALLSLSDYLQPWCDVVRALEGAYASGLTVALYNPVKRGITEKLAEVRRIFHDRQILLVRDAGRPDEELREIPVSGIVEENIDMRTLILCLSPKVKPLPGRGKFGRAWLEPRGYESEEAKTKDELKSEGLHPKSTTAKFDTEPQGSKTSNARFLVLGGTTEGRAAASALLEAGYGVTVSVAREAGVSTVPEGASVIVGARDAASWHEFLSSTEAGGHIAGAVDASHPFAVNATQELNDACSELGVPLCRFERPDIIPDDAQVVSSPEEAAELAVRLTSERDAVLLATGVNMLPVMLPILRASERAPLARMLPTEQSMTQAAAAGLSPREIIAVWGPGGASFNEAVCAEFGIKCIISKASGDAGGVPAKHAAAKKLGIPLILIKRPEDSTEVTKISRPDELLDWCKVQKRELRP